MKRLFLVTLAFTLLLISSSSPAQAPVMTSWVSDYANETEIQLRMHDRTINDGYALCEVSFSMSAARCALSNEVRIYVYQNDGSGTYGTVRYSVGFDPGPGAVPISTSEMTRILVVSSGSTEPIYARAVISGVSASDDFVLTTPDCITTIVSGDSYDPNESYPGASTIADAVTHEGLVVNADADWYEFTIPTVPLELIVNMEYLNDYRTTESNLDLDLFVTGSTGTILYSSISSATSTTGPITETIDEILDPGTYYMLVCSKENQPNRNFYTLNWDTYTPPNYQISGDVRDEQNNGISGVTMNGLPGDPVTNVDGHYGVVVQQGWDGTVTPTLAGYSFTPVSRTYTDVAEAHVSDNYTAILDNPNISGRITDGSGTGVEGVTLSGFPAAVVTDAGGYYSGTVWYNWSGDITPIAEGLTFTPASRNYTQVQVHQTDEDYTAATGTVTVSGTVTLDPGGDPIEGVVLMGSPGPAVTNSNGEYSFDVLYGSSFIFSPILAGYDFSPANYEFTNISSNSVVDFSGTLDTYTISGNVQISGGTPVSGVRMSGLPGDPLTDGYGNYSATVDFGWSGTVSPVLAGYSFDPVSVTYSNVNDSQSQNYTATQDNYTLEGYVRTSGGVAIQGVVMAGLPGDPVTDADGYYVGYAVYGVNMTITPTLAGYSFVPPSVDYFPVTDDETTDFTGTPDLILNVDQHMVMLSFEAGASDVVNVSSNVDWAVSCPESWITCSPGAGSGNGSFTITANTANPGMESRDAIVTVSGGGISQTIGVEQAGSDATLEVSPVVLSLGTTAGSTGSVTITSNLSWTATETADWLSVSPAGGTGNGSLTITADLENTASGSRTASVTVSGEGITRIIEVTQTGSDPSLEVSATEVRLGATAGSYGSVSITSNISWTASETAGWLTITPTSGTGNGSLTIIADFDNSSVDSQITTVTVEGEGITRSIEVTQEGAEALLEITTPTAPLAADSGASMTLDVTSTVDWEVTVDDDWLTVIPALSSGSQVLTLRTRSANTLATERSTSLHLEGGGILRNVSIAQAAGSTAGMGDKFEMYQLELYPNPARDLVFLMLNAQESHEVLLKVMSLTGRVLLEQPHLQLIPGTPLEIDLGMLPAGQYLIQLSGAQVRQILKVVKYE